VSSEIFVLIEFNLPKAFYYGSVYISLHIDQSAIADIYILSVKCNLALFST